jgi:hypothetical protein
MEVSMIALQVFKRRQVWLVKLSIMIGVVLLSGLGAVQAAEPVNITYGYHPYWTGGWTGVVINKKSCGESTFQQAAR